MKILIILFLLTPALSFSQIYSNREIGVINDKDGFVFIRDSQSKDSKIIDSLFIGEFFLHIKNDTSDWYKVYKMWNVDGFVHKSRIQNIKSFDRNYQIKLIDSIFNNEKKYYKMRLTRTTFKRDSIMNYHDKKFVPTLELFIHTMCKKYDNQLMKEFFDILILESGSADESQPAALGFIYKCHPELINNLVKEYNNKTINNALEFGKHNINLTK